MNMPPTRAIWLSVIIAAAILVGDICLSINKSPQSPVLLFSFFFFSSSVFHFKSEWYISLSLQLNLLLTVGSLQTTPQRLVTCLICLCCHERRSEWMSNHKPLRPVMPQVTYCFFFCFFVFLGGEVKHHWSDKGRKAQLPNNSECNSSTCSLLQSLHNKAIRHICKVGYVMFLLQSNNLQLGDSKGLEF